VRAGLGAGIDEAAFRVGAGDDGGDAHVEVGVGLGLGVHAGKAVDETGDEEFAGAVDDAGVFGNGDLVRQADVGDAASRMTTMAPGMSRAESPQEVTSTTVPPARTSGTVGARGLWLRLDRNRGQSAADHKKTREKVEQSHGDDDLKRIVAQRQ
jgi:hypothetical protein